MAERFTVEPPEFDPPTGVARFRYGLGELTFTEIVAFPAGAASEPSRAATFQRLLGLTAIVLGVSYFKLRAPFEIHTPIPLSDLQRRFVLDVYENGLGEFYARNGLRRFGQLRLHAPEEPVPAGGPPELPDRSLLPIGGGKDSLVSAQLLERAGINFSPFAVNPKGPILGSVEALGRAPLYVQRTLDAEMIRLGKEPGFFNGHVPSTAINSMIAALAALLFGFRRVILSNERSASEGNVEFDGREANHQHSKSLPFERLIASVLADASGGALQYFSLLRPFSEARIARLFARESRFDRVFSSCNENFKLAGNSGPLWCGRCPKCHFVYLIMAPVMDRPRLAGIFGQDLLAQPAHEHSFRTLTGLAGQKPWECVGEIEEAAACLHALAADPHWSDEPLVQTLRPDLLAQYGAPRLDAALAALMVDAPEHLIPPEIFARVSPHAV
jgi:UDP-N-acetyl-alpha-D-muramoyl-L-alanyl-L-glutamate epimerase